MPYTCNGKTMSLRAWERHTGISRALIKYRMKRGMRFEEAVTVPVDRRRDVDDRFMDCYTPEPNTGCWLWLSSTTVKGYGRLSDHQKIVPAHRYSYQRFVGQITDGLHVLHKCDMPGCVNPDHLFLGTNADNVADKVAKGRTTKGRPHKRKGSAHGAAKLTEDAIIEIRTRKASAKEYAEKFGVTVWSIYKAMSGTTWQHV